MAERKLPKESFAPIETIVLSENGRPVTYKVIDVFAEEGELIDHSEGANVHERTLSFFIRRYCDGTD